MSSSISTPYAAIFFAFRWDLIMLSFYLQGVGATTSHLNANFLKDSL